MVTTSRVIAVCVLIWVVFLIVTAIVVVFNAYYVLTIGSLVISCIMVFCYYNIFVILRYHHNQIQAQVGIPQGQNSTLNLSHFKKTVGNLLCIIVWFLVSYAMLICAVTIISIQGMATSMEVLRSWMVSIDIVCLNSAINPLIYCWRLEELRSAMKETWALMISKIRGSG